MKSFLKKIKTYKKGLVILLLLTIFSVLFLLLKKEDSKKEEIKYPKIRDNEIVEKDKTKYLKLIEATPKSGIVVRDLSDTIVMKFDKNININSLIYSVNPEISLSAKTFGNKQQMHIFPDRKWWEEGIEYKIIIEQLQSSEGLALEKPIMYIYTRTPAKDLLLGDPPPPFRE